MSDATEGGARCSTPSAVPCIVYHLLRILLGALFLVASLEKIERPWDFGRAIYAYSILVGPFAYLISPAAIVMPALEFVCGALLVINLKVRQAALAILAMNVVFIAAIVSVIARGLDIECGCGLDVGFLGTQADAGALIRDLVILAVSLVILLAPQSTGRKT